VAEVASAALALSNELDDVGQRLAGVEAAIGDKGTVFSFNSLVQFQH